MKEFFDWVSNIIKIITALCGKGSSPSPNPNPPPDNFFSPLQLSLLTEINKVRKQSGVLEVTISESLSKIASDHAEYMASKNVLSHIDGNGNKLDKRLELIKYKASLAAENIANGFPNSQSVVQGWLNSEDHRRSMLGKYEQVGLGIAKTAEGRMYWCLDLATPGLQLVSVVYNGGTTLL